MENLLSFVLLFSSIFVGILLELFLTYRVRTLLAKNNWLKGGKILKAFKGISFLTFLGIGVFLFVHYSSFNSTWDDYFTKGLIIVLIISACTIISRIAIGYLTSDHDKKEFQGTSIITNITRVAVYGIGLVIILQTLGISVTPMLTAIGVGGLAVALALQDTLSNLFAGIYIIASKKLLIGDYIKLQSGEEGFIQDISWRTITIIDPNETIVVVPNSTLSTAIFRNFNFPSPEVITQAHITVSYNNDLHLVEKLALKTAQQLIAASPICIKTHVPIARFHTFTEFGIQFFVTFRVTQATDQGAIRHAFIVELMRVFKKNNIEVSDRLALRDQLKI